MVKVSESYKKRINRGDTVSMSSNFPYSFTSIYLKIESLVRKIAT